MPIIQSTHTAIPNSVVVDLDSLIELRLHAGKTMNATRKKSVAQRAGNFTSPFRGRGMDFSEVRLYQPGDDIRSIDWRVTARTGKTHTKLFTEERERAIYFVVDTGANMQFGTQVSFKSVVASKVAALLAWSSMSHGDRVGGIFYAGSLHKEIKPVGGKRGVLTFLKRLVDWNRSTYSEIDHDSSAGFIDVLSRLKRIAKPGSLVFIISDFSALTSTAKRYLSQISQHCEIAMINVFDELERHAPPNGNYMLSDGVQSGRFIVSGNKIDDAIYGEFSENEKLLKQFCMKNGIHNFSITSTDDLVRHVSDNMHRRVGSKASHE